MLLLYLQQALVDKVTLLLGLLLNCTITVYGSMTPNRIGAIFFHLSLELCQWVVVEGLENIFGGETSVTPPGQSHKQQQESR